MKNKPTLSIYDAMPVPPIPQVVSPVVSTWHSQATAHGMFPVSMAVSHTSLQATLTIKYQTSTGTSITGNYVNSGDGQYVLTGTPEIVWQTPVPADSWYWCNGQWSQSSISAALEAGKPAKEALLSAAAHARALLSASENDSEES